MRQLLISLIPLFFIACNQLEKGNKTNSIGYESQDERVISRNSILSLIDLYPYDSMQRAMDLIRNSTNLTSSEYAQNYFAPEILTSLSRPEKYQIPADIPDSPCDGFFSIERDQFRSGTRTFYTSVTRADDNKIKLFGLVKGEFKKNSKAFIIDYCNFIDTTCSDGWLKKKVRLSAGLRIIYFVKDWGLNIGIDGLEKIAAAKELNRSESSLEVLTLGWGQGNAALDTLKNVLQKISVKNYPEACSALLNLLDAYKMAKSLKPEILPIE